MQNRERGTEPEVPLSDYEAQLYDRNIRCWGIEAQKRIRGARILLIGFKSMNAEICKNLVLAGINSVTIVDTEIVTPRDLCSNIFLTAADIGIKRGEAVVSSVRALNPLVDVQFKDADPLKLEDVFLKSFNLVCASICLLSTMVKLNNQCRELGVHFIATDTFCLSAYFFSDLHKFHYNVAETGSASDTNKGTDPPAKKARKDMTVEFVSLEKALATKWTKLGRRTAKLYYGMQLVYALKEAEASNKDSDQDPSKIWAQLVSEHEGKQEVLSEEYKIALLNNLGCEFVPVSAIVAGIAAQEMIKILSANDEPLNNFFFYDSSDGSGLVERIGA
jgi:molybdopterin/thiamine biosynthesis adenylyltransferase